MLSFPSRGKTATIKHSAIMSFLEGKDYLALVSFNHIFQSQKVEDLFNKAIAQADSLNEAMTAMMNCANEIEGSVPPTSMEAVGGLCGALNTINKLVNTLSDK